MSETLLNEIRSTRPAAPESLRERVRELAAQEPTREPFLARLQWRNLLVVAPATLVVAVVAAGVIGLTRDGVTGDEQSASSGGATGMATLESAAPERALMCKCTLTLRRRASSGACWRASFCAAPILSASYHKKLERR